MLQTLYQRLEGCKSTQDTLHDAPLDFQVFFDTHPSPMWVFHVQTGQLVAVNGAALAAFGYTREEICTTQAPLLGGDDPHRPKPWICRRKDGTTFWAHKFRTKDFVSHNRPLRLVELQEISLEGTSTPHGQDLERRLRTLVHDFNNQLTVLLGALSLIQARPDTPPAIVGVLKAADSSGQRAMALLEELRSLYRPATTGEPTPLPPMAKPQSPPTRNGTSSSCSQTTLLLVEDEPMIRILAQTILQHHGFRVFLAEDGAKAVEIYRQNRGRINLVLLDINLPTISGEETLAQLYELDPNVNVLLATGHGTDEVMGSGSNRVLGCVNKPYRSEDLVTQVRAVLKRAVGKA